MRTPLCDLVGIEAPIVLAPMGGAVTPELAAAVSNAGALGMLPLTWTPADEVVSVIEETRGRTSLPIGVNLGLEWDQNARLAAALSVGVRVFSFFWVTPAVSYAKRAKPAQSCSSRSAQQKRADPRLPPAPT